MLLCPASLVVIAAATRYRVRRRGFAMSTNPKSVGGIDGVEALPKRGAMTGQKIRDWVMQRDSGLCQPCAKSGAVSAGQEVNYIDPKAQVKRPGWTGEQMDARENLQAICRACHAAKAARETRGLLAHLCPDRLSQGLNAAGRAFTKRSIQLAECFGVASHSVKTVF